MNELVNKKFREFITSVNKKNFLRCELMFPVIKKYGARRTGCLLSSRIFNEENIRTTEEIINIFSIGLSKELDAVLNIISEMIDDGMIEAKTILYAFNMGYDYTFTINLILQFYDLLRVMSNYKIEKISDKINHKSIYTFFRECDLKTAKESAKLIEDKNEAFFNELNGLEIKLAYII